MAVTAVVAIPSITEWLANWVCTGLLGRKSTRRLVFVQADGTKSLLITMRLLSKGHII